MTTNRYPVDSATRPCCGGLGSHTQECPVSPKIVDHVDSTAHRCCGAIGARHARGCLAGPPAWCLPDAWPVSTDTDDDGTETEVTWRREISPHVSIDGTDMLVDGRWQREAPGIFVDVPHGVAAATARQLARDLMTAANLLADVEVSDSDGSIR